MLTMSDNFTLGVFYVKLTQQLVVIQAVVIFSFGSKVSNHCNALVA